MALLDQGKEIPGKERAMDRLNLVIFFQHQHSQLTFSSRSPSSPKPNCLATPDKETNKLKNYITNNLLKDVWTILGCDFLTSTSSDRRTLFLSGTVSPSTDFMAVKYLNSSSKLTLLMPINQKTARKLYILKVKKYKCLVTEREELQHITWLQRSLSLNK